MSRLVNNTQLKITQTSKVLPRQLLDAALLAPAVPKVASSAASRFQAKWEEEVAMTAESTSNNDGSSFSSKQKEAYFVAPQNKALSTCKSPIEIERAKAERTWELLEVHALLALPSLR